MITNYKQAKEDVLKVYYSFLPLIEQIKGRKETTYDKSLDALVSQAKNIEEDKFRLMIVGEAKSGKSTFINAYLGAEILPMDVKQCSSVIVEIRYGEKFTLKATYADGRTKIVENESKIKDFLTKNAALDDDYRDIPVTVINTEILMKKRGKEIKEEEIQEFLKGVESENLYRLSKEKYEGKIRQYIKKHQHQWKNIVDRIEIEYPFADTDLKGIQIIDTPGVNADGRVGDVTNKYIEEANAVMFLKPLSGAALEATSFKNFLESKSADRNKSAIFLTLTGAAKETGADVTRVHEEAIRQFSSIINQKQIIPIDSKAKLFYNVASTLTTEELEAYLMKMAQKDALDGFIMLAWVKAYKDRDNFLKTLKELSRFDVINDALNQFAHKAHYLMLNEFLGRMRDVVANVSDDLTTRIGYYKEKVVNEDALAEKIENAKNELKNLTKKLDRTVNEVRKKYSSKEDGVIVQKAGEVIEQYKKEIARIDPEKTTSVDELEKISFRKIDIFIQFEDELKKNIIAECDEALVAISDKRFINFTTIKPDLTKETFEKIKEEMKQDSYESYTYTTGITFTTTHKRSRFSQKKYFGLVKASIEKRIEKIRKDAIKDLRQFVKSTTMAYREELEHNAKIKRDELNEIVKKKQTEEEIKAKIQQMEGQHSQLSPISKQIINLKGSIEQYV